MKNSEILQKYIKRGFIFSISSFVLIIVGIICCFVGNNISKDQSSKNKENFDNLRDEYYDDQLGRTVYVDNIDGVYPTYYEYTEKKKYNKNVENYYLLYYTTDEGTYGCIVKLVNEKLEDYLQKKKNFDISNLNENNTISLMGVTEKIDNDVKEELIKILKDDSDFDEEYINDLTTNFDKYFSSSLINLSRRYYSPLEVSGWFISIISLIIFIINIYGFIITRKTIKNIKSTLSLEDIYNDVDSQNVKLFNKTKTILLDKYLICFDNGLKIIYYKNIKEITPLLQKIYGKMKSGYINIKLNNNKNIKIATHITSNNLTDEQEEILAELTNKIKVK